MEWMSTPSISKINASEEEMTGGKGFKRMRIARSCATPVPEPSQNAIIRRILLYKSIFRRILRYGLMALGVVLAAEIVVPFINAEHWGKLISAALENTLGRKWKLGRSISPFFRALVLALTT